MRRILSLVMLLVLSACALATPLPYRPDIDTSVTLTREPTVATPTQIALSPTSLVSPVSTRFSRNCLQINRHIPEEVVMQGHVITIANEVESSFAEKTVAFPVDESFENKFKDLSIQILGISPDGQWLFYGRKEAPGDSLTIEGFSWLKDTPLTTEIDIIPRDKSTWTSWLDNERQVFHFYLENPIVVNMFNGETETININYPGFHLDETGYSPLFSRDLNRMIAYRNIPDEPPSIVLWDLQSKSEVQRLYITPEVAHRNLVQVSPNGNQIAVSGALDYFFDDLFLDIFLTDWDGNLEQLTTFRDSELTASLIEQMQWSPDGRYLAFWLNESLAVYDTVTRAVTDYCIRSSNSMSFSPHWSPNSQQIVFNGYVPPPGSGPIIVVDIVNGLATEIQENGYFVVGWMVDTR